MRKDEELDDLSGQAQLWEAAKTRLEMQLEQMRKEHRKEIAQLTEEMEEIRANAQKKVRGEEYFFITYSSRFQSKTAEHFSRNVSSFETSNFFKCN